MTTRLICLALSGAAAAAAPADAVTKRVFGKTQDGRAVHEYTLKNDTVTVKLIDLGATVTQILVPGRGGEVADVVFGFDDVAGYESEANGYFGCTVGRVCNRIAEGKFSLNGKTYTLATNNGPNHLHGGKRGFDKKVWAAEPVSGKSAVRFTCASADGEEGYPGKVEAQVTFTLTGDNALRIEYAVTADEATPVNLTNHSYFNLAGAGAATVLDHMLKLSASKYTPTDDTLIPTGEIKPVKGTPLDFTEMTRIGARVNKLTGTAAKGYDHNFVIDGEPGKLRPAAVLKDPKSGRVMEVMTDQPGVQFYSGNFLSGKKGKGGKAYALRSAVCLETQCFPDSVNHAEFPSVILKPGETYKHVCVYKFSTAK